MYDAFPDLPEIYDSVPAYVARRDVAFYVDEAKDAGGRVLEVGCGTGRVLLPIARSGRAIDGIDASPPMLERCRAKLQGEPDDVRQRVTLHRADARKFDLGHQFDLVIAPFRVMQHLISIEDQLAFLESAARHLTPGGRLAFDVFNPHFSALVSADGTEREDTPDTKLPDGRSFRRAGAVARVRWIDQVSEVELVYYISREAGAPIERRVQSFDMRWFLCAELVHLLARTGFQVRSIYGDFNRSPLTDKSPEQIVCAERVTPPAT
ncbi:MAG TPA: class I SAM-dependent methyltransferase [Gemmatimonadaceae bacterium]|nr:class I SAM-dependent methyltransferase [Gemmatimonadaceae bacterium]